MANDAFTKQGVSRFLEIHKDDSPDDIVQTFLLMQAELMVDSHNGPIPQQRMDEFKALGILFEKVQSGELTREREAARKAAEAREAAEQERLRLKREAQQLHEEAAFLATTSARSREGLLVCEVLQQEGSPLNVGELQATHPFLAAVSVEDLTALVQRLADEGCVALQRDGRAVFRHWVAIPESLRAVGDPSVDLDLGIIDSRLAETLSANDNWTSRRAKR